MFKAIIVVTCLVYLVAQLWPAGLLALLLILN